MNAALRTLMLLFMLAAFGCAKHPQSDDQSDTAMKTVTISQLDLLCFGNNGPELDVDFFWNADSHQILSRIQESASQSQETCASDSGPNLNDSVFLLNGSIVKLLRLEKVVFKWIGKLKLEVTVFARGSTQVSRKIQLTAVPYFRDGKTASGKFVMAAADQRYTAELKQWSNELAALRKTHQKTTLDREILDEGEVLLEDLHHWINKGDTVRVVKDASGRIQAAGAFVNRGSKTECFEVKSLLTRPGNIILSVPQAGRVSGAGSSLVRYALQEHLQKGGKRCVELLADPGAVQAYLKMGFLRVTGIEMKLEGKALDNFLAGK